MKRALLLLAVSACCPPEPAKKAAAVTAKSEKPAVKDLALPGETHLKNLRQITFGANNAEAYWAFGGDKLIMQTDRAPYKCDQIMEIDLKSPTYATKLVSTGQGRTTCSYFLKGDQDIIYASTHENTGAACPTPPDMSKGYLWGLFDYDIYSAKADGSGLHRLTNEPGYDAEATVCAKDGSILFTSTRSGDPELWRMDADGKNPRQLTNLIGYDGGGFFSADCSKIIWRSSRPQGEELVKYKELLAQHLVMPTHMDLWIANSDGTDARQLTYLPGASFAPFFFPDGKRVIFASNQLSPRGPEFDLFAVDIDGTHLERLTTAPSFDGFPMFSPDGKTLSFSSNRRDTVPAKDGKSEVYRLTGGPAGVHDTNVFLADWVDTGGPRASSEPTFQADAFMSIVSYLADDKREGRGVGTQGLRDAQKTIEDQLKAWGLEVSEQQFDVTTKVERGDKTTLELDGKAVAADAFTPLASSGNGTASGDVVAVGWGIRDTDAKLDEFKGKQLKGKIALVHRFVPPTAKLEAPAAARLGDLRFKAYVAKGLGAVGLIVVDDGDPKQDEAELPRLAAAESESGIPIVVVKRAAIAKGGFKKAKISVELKPVRTPTFNIIAKIPAGAAKKLPGKIVIGAHLDHLGMGGPPSALDKELAVHNGADDNASGVAGLMQVAHVLVGEKAKLARDIELVAFSGEEMGDLGSEHYVKVNPAGEPIYAMLNMDMIGRMRNNQLQVNGGASATEWQEIAGPACKAAGVLCTIGGSGYGPSDHMPFYVKGSPVLFFFTGSHSDYHTATDDSDKINAIGGAHVAMIVTDIARAIANREAALTYVKAPPEPMGGGDVRLRGASLGTIPSYNEDPNAPPGMTLSDVRPDGPAATAGLKGGDRITQIGTAEIRSVMDLMYVLEAAKPGQEVKITFVRDGKTMTTNATYSAPSGRR